MSPLSRKITSTSSSMRSLSGMLEVANEMPMLLNSDVFAKAMQGSKEALVIVLERSFPQLQTIMSRLSETIPPDPIP